MLAQLSLWLCLALHAFIQPFPVPSADLHSSHLPANRSFPAYEKFHTLSTSPSSDAFPCLSGIINDYTPVLGFGCDSSTLQVGTSAGFAAGDEVLLLQMQVPQVDLSNTASFGTLLNSTCIGNYEFNRIKSVGGSTVQLQYALTRSYDLSGKVQLVRVPEYDSATVCALTCLPWNGSVGGVLALDVRGQLTLSSDIDVSGRGFRGGNVEQDNTIAWVFGETQYTYPPQPTLAAAKGEGIVMIPTGYSYGRGRAGNGGGGGNAHNAGGGGGANAGAGGDGGLEIVNLPSPAVLNTNGIGGAKYFDNDVNKILLGGGAGAGHANDGRGTSGGNGGGIAIILANTLQTNNFRILSNGVDVFGGFDQNDGQGGGGAGGTVVLKVSQLNGALPCELKGGRGGSNPYHIPTQLHGPGGGGSGGKLLLSQNLPGIIPSLQGGINGVTTQNFTNGATPGEFGQVLAGFVLPAGNLLTHPVSNHLLLVVQPVSCTSTTNGQIAVLQSTALAFRLNGGAWQSDSVFTGLSAGNYQLSLQFSGGCTLDTTALITASPPLRDTLLSLVTPSCTGGGSLTVAAISGTAPFEFQINNGPWQPNGVFNNLPSGLYNITLRDAAGCTKSNVYTLTPPLALRDSLLSIVAASCLTGGSITITAAVGTPPFEFQINSGAWQPNGVFTNLSPGNYITTLRDAAGCTYATSHTVLMSPPSLDSLISLVNAGCSVGGQIVVTAVSGTAPFEFQLNGGPWQPNGSFTNLSPGSYNITLHDAAGCTHTGTYVVGMSPPVLDSLVSLTDAGCVLGGSIIVAAVSGTAPFEFRINGGNWQPNGSFTNLSPGSYNITLRDAVGCTQTTTYVVGMSPPAFDSLVSLTNAGCVSGGSIIVNAVSGTAPFEFQINGGAWQPSDTFLNLVPGNYTVRLRDAAGCTYSSTHTVNAAPPALAELVTLTNAQCIMGGTIVVAPVSGTAPFQFQVDGGPWQGGIFMDLPSGVHTVVVRDTLGCTHSSQYSVAVPMIVHDSLVSLTNAGCSVGGTIVEAAVSGTAPFEFQLNGGPWQSNSNFPNLSAGEYTLILRDAASCTDTSTYVITAPPLAADSLVSLGNAGCTFGGNIRVAAVAGTAPFEFQIDSSAWQTSGIFPDLLPGSYTIRLRDSVGCTDSSNYVINPPLPLRDSLLVLINAGCTIGGGLAVTAVSGTAPFEYQLDNGPWQSGGVFLDLPAGMHKVALRDGAGCTDSSTYNIASPPPVQDSLLALVRAGCTFGGGLAVAAVGGTAPFTYQLDNGPRQYGGVFWDLPSGSYNITVRDTVGCTHSSIYTIAPPLPVRDSLLVLLEASCISPGGLAVAPASGQAPFEYQLNNGPWQESGVFLDLPPGSYLLTLRDTAGCTDTSTYVVPAPSVPRDSLVLLVNPGCTFPGGLVVAAVAGRAPFTFQLNNGPAQASGVFWDLSPGPYTITLRDSAGCMDTGTYLISPPPPARDSLFSLVNAGCTFGGKILTDAVSGTAPFEFQVNGGAWQTNGTFSDLPPGNYSIVLRDSAGCRDTSAYMVKPPPPALDSLLSLVSANCTAGGAISVTATAGTAPFEFQLNGGTWQPDGDFTNLLPGNYLITLRDSVGCTDTSTYSVIGSPPVLDSLLSVVRAGCTFGGSIIVGAISGIQPFEYQLNGGAWQADGTFTNLPAGEYNITLRDTTGCTHTSTYEVPSSPPVLDSLVSLVRAGCTVGGKIEVGAIGGTAPFTFQLNTGALQTSGVFPNLLPGNYTLVLQDAAGCVHSSTYAVAAPLPVLDSLILLTAPGCREEGSLRVAGVSGIPPFQFQLNGEPWQPDGDFTDLPAGTYVITIRDSVGCLHNSTYVIAPYIPLALEIGRLEGIDCQHTFGSITVIATGGSGHYNYRLNNGSPPQSSGYFPELSADEYMITVTDSAGCTTELSNLEVTTTMNTASTSETVTIYEGAYFELPDGRRVGQAGQFSFSYQTAGGCDSLHIINLVVLQRNVYVPNIFHPNDDSDNDYFTVFSDASLAVVRRLAVYDRWGELLFEKRDMPPNQERAGWDGQFRGRLVDAGVFVWVAELEFVDGLKRTIWGDVTVLR